MLKLRVTKGDIGVPIYRASLFQDNEQVRSVNSGHVKVESGYGVTEKDAITDFINENIPDLIDFIFREIKVETKKNKLQSRHTKA